MRSTYQNFDFPVQRVSNAEKKKPEWYANCCDWIISQGQGMKNLKNLETRYQILNGQISDELYKKVLNTYN